MTVEHTWEDEEKEEMSGTFVLSISRDPEEIKEAEESENEEEEITAYARVGESKIIYKLTTDQYKELIAATYNDLRHQEVLSADFADIYQLDISLDGKDYTITSEEEDDERTYYYNEEEIDLYDFRLSFDELEANSFTDEEPTEKEEISVVVYLDNENYPEVSIELYRYDGENCLAVVDGETVSLVRRSDVIDVIEAVNTIVLN